MNVESRVVIQVDFVQCFYYGNSLDAGNFALDSWELVGGVSVAGINSVDVDDGVLWAGRISGDGKECAMDVLAECERLCVNGSAPY